MLPGSRQRGRLRTGRVKEEGRQGSLGILVRLSSGVCRPELTVPWSHQESSGCLPDLERSSGGNLLFNLGSMSVGDDSKFPGPENQHRHLAFNLYQKWPPSCFALGLSGLVQLCLSSSRSPAVQESYCQYSVRRDTLTLVLPVLS